MSWQNTVQAQSLYLPLFFKSFRTFAEDFSQKFTSLLSTLKFVQIHPILRYFPSTIHHSISRAPIRLFRQTPNPTFILFQEASAEDDAEFDEEEELAADETCE